MDEALDATGAEAVKALADYWPNSFKTTTVELRKLYAETCRGYPVAAVRKGAQLLAKKDTRRPSPTTLLAHIKDAAGADRIDTAEKAQDCLNELIDAERRAAEKVFAELPAGDLEKHAQACTRSKVYMTATMRANPDPHKPMLRALIMQRIKNNIPPDVPHRYSAYSGARVLVPDV